LALAATPVGVIRSSETFQLRGVPVSVAGVPSWPVVAGDDIATAGSSAVISFKDGSRVTLDKKTRAKIDADGSFHLLQGTVWFKVAPGSRLRIVSVDKPVLATPGVEGKATTLAVSGGDSSSRPVSKGTLKPASISVYQ